VGARQRSGGIEVSVRLGAAVGLPATELWSMQQVLPSVRFAVDAYVSFARRQPWQEAACASLTELFAPSIHRERLATWPVHYPWIENSGLEYFRSRIWPLSQDIQCGLRITLEHFLRFKLDLLWSILGALHLRHGLAGR
jgi:pyrroloquinoline-quinone synthase